jgi:hypothetical protein
MFKKTKGDGLSVDSKLKDRKMLATGSVGRSLWFGCGERQTCANKNTSTYVYTKQGGNDDGYIDIVPI